MGNTYAFNIVGGVTGLVTQHLGKACEQQHAVTQLHEWTVSSFTNLIKDKRKRERVEYFTRWWQANGSWLSKKPFLQKRQKKRRFKQIRTTS